MRNIIAEHRLYDALDTLNIARERLRQAGAIGQDPTRYHGAGFGNISARLRSTDRNQDGFLISGTQTGDLACLSKKHWAWVYACDPDSNRVCSVGEINPSAESMTHAMIYSLSSQVKYVVHVHLQALWQMGPDLGLAQSASDVRYGTPEMAYEMTRLYHTGATMITMAGHEDGVLAFGEDLDRTVDQVIAQQDIACTQLMR